MSKPFDPAKLTHSALLRFAEAVHAVMSADDLTARQRRDLIGHWAYRFEQKDMPAQLQQAISRCRADPDDLPSLSTTCRTDAITGEMLAANPAR